MIPKIWTHLEESKCNKTKNLEPAIYFNETHSHASLAITAAYLSQRWYQPPCHRTTQWPRIA